MYQKKKQLKNEFFFFFKLRFFSYVTGLGTPLSIGIVSSWFQSISNAYCVPGTMQGVTWGYHSDSDENPEWS